jgi:hypothetical protein
LRSRAPRQARGIEVENRQVMTNSHSHQATDTFESIDTSELVTIAGGFGFDGINWSGSAASRYNIISHPGGSRTIYLNGRNVTNMTIRR